MLYIALILICISLYIVLRITYNVRCWGLIIISHFDNTDIQSIVLVIFTVWGGGQGLKFSNFFVFFLIMIPFGHCKGYDICIC